MIMTTNINELQTRIREEFGKEYSEKQCDKLATELVQYLEYHLV